MAEHRFIRRALGGLTALTLAGAALLPGFALAAGTVYTVEVSYAEAAAHSRALNQQLMEEGAVLLKNDGTLPLAAGSKVTLLGSGSFNTVWGETGGGNGKKEYTYLADSLAAAGFDMNPETAAVYQGLSKVNLSGADVVLDPDVSALDGVKDSFAAYGDAAILTISRSGKESTDILLSGLQEYGWEQADDHQLRLNSQERALIALAKEQFSRVVVLLNLPSTMEAAELQEDDGISAILYIGLPGQYGLDGVGPLLTGVATPSGKTASLWPRDLTKDPTYPNAAAHEAAVGDTASVAYEEGIYLGYKYYETADAEAKAGNYDGFDYDAQVLYPFGYGLSYTSFDAALEPAAIDLSGKGLDDTITLQATLTNTGDTYSGKAVAELYVHTPYTPGGIEKAEVALAAFAKTAELAPGASETVDLTVRLADLASYDYNDANGDGWYGYEIEAGSYELRLQSDSHSLAGSDTVLHFEVEETLRIHNDGTPTTAESNTAEDTVFSRGDDFDTLAPALAENGGGFVALSRADFAATFPKEAAGTVAEGWTVPTRYSDAFTPADDLESDPWYVAEVPADWTQGAETAYTLWDIASIEPDSEEVLTEGAFAGLTGQAAWTAFLNQLSWTDLVDLISRGSHKTVAVASIAKPAQADTDGPEQLGNGTFWVCANVIASTWNTVLAEQRGEAMGDESLYDGFTGWYGPGVNLNRTPFGGRNNIYFSEDALLAGRIAAAVVRGVQSRGVIPYLKHFALNEQETNRAGLITWVSEQALRETYLKAFELAVKEGGALGIMQAMNRVGAVNSFGNYALDVEVLRDEWHFKGGVITDSYNAALVRENMAQRMGCDFPLGSWTVDIAGEWDADQNMVVYEGAASPTQWAAVRTAAQHILYMAANSNQLKNGYNVSVVADKTVDTITGTVGVEIDPVDLSIDAAALGAAHVTYSATSLPDGFSLDAETGLLTGTPVKSGKASPKVVVTVDAPGEGWISVSYKISINISKAK